MLAAVLPDLHLQGLDDPVQGDVVALIDALEAPELFLLGDAFHFWWPFPAVVYAEFVPFLAALHRAVRRGTRVTWLLGNHDFRLGAFLTEEVGVEAAATCRRRLGEHTYLLAHGDQADASTGYRLARRLLRGRPFHLLLRSLGPAGARRLGHRLAGASREAPADGDGLIEAQRSWARRELERHDAEVAVLGHAHRPGRWSLGGGRTLINVGDFRQARTWLRIDREGASLREGLPPRDVSR